MAFNFFDQFKSAFELAKQNLGFGGTTTTPTIAPTPPPPTQTQQAATAVSTPQQLAQQVTQQSRQAISISSQYYKIATPSGFDIFNKATGKKLSYEEALPLFKAGTLNVDWVPERFTPTPQEANVTDLADGTMQAPIPSIPDINTGLKESISTFSNQFQIFFDETQKFLDDLKTQEGQRITAEEREKELIGRFETFFANRPSQQQLFGETLAGFGVTPELINEQIGIARQIGQISQEMALIEEQKQITLPNEGARPGVQLGFIEGRLAKVEKQFNSRINAKAAQAGALQAQLEAQRGNLEQARSLAAQVVSAAVADQQADFDEINTLFTLNQNIISRLDEQTRNTLDLVRQNRLLALNETKDQIQTKMNLILQFPEAKISFTDDLVTAFSKAQAAGAARLAFEQAPGVGGGGGTTANLKDINNYLEGLKVRLDAGQIDISQVPTDYQGYFVPVDEYKGGKKTGNIIYQIVPPVTGEFPPLGKTTAPTDPVSIFQQLKDQGLNREQIEEQWKKDNNQTEIPDSVDRMLDQVFGSWWNPF